jgi:uncharacterized membrane protein
VKTTDSNSPVTFSESQERKIIFLICLLGALIPFLLLYLSGINFLLRDVKNKWARPMTLAAMILFMLISEIISDWPVFQSQYNWYHL